MLVADYKAGQLANRLFHFSYFIAHSLEHHYRLVHPYFEDYEHYFELQSAPGFRDGSISLHFSGNRFIERTIKNSIGMVRRLAKKNKQQFLFIEFHDIKKEYDSRYLEFDMSDPSFVYKVKQRVVFAKGWNYRDAAALHKHAETIRKIFTPKQEYAATVDAIATSCKSFDVCIGIHIRRGDYKAFFDGRWYYDNSVYASKMYFLQDWFARQGKRCVFLICSNEPVQASDFPGLDILSGEREPITDLYSLATCDYLVGPPSTFTLWASFYGKVPLLMLKHKDIIPDPDNFSVYEGVVSFF